MATLELASNKRGFIKKTEEYFNAIRTNIQLSGSELKVIGITSVESNEGKSTTAASLAIAYARSGYKTILLDADIRNSVMSGFFKPATKITGLTDYLAGTTDLSQGLCDTDVPNLTVIESGKASPNPTALLQSKNFDNLIIFDVDDGPKTLEESLGLIEEARHQGVRMIIATSHRRKGMFETPEKIIMANYLELKKRWANFFQN